MDRNELLDILSDIVRAPADENEQQREALGDFLIGLSRRQILQEQQIKDLKTELAEIQRRDSMRLI